jgi:hypothetical protein
MNFETSEDDLATIRKAMEESERGEGDFVDAFFDRFRAELLAMKRGGFTTAKHDQPDQ